MERGLIWLIERKKTNILYNAGVFVRLRKQFDMITKYNLIEVL